MSSTVIAPVLPAKSALDGSGVGKRPLKSPAVQSIAQRCAPPFPMPSSPLSPEPASTTAPTAVWSRLRQRHFFDYPVGSLRLWLLIAACGAAAWVWAALGLLAMPGGSRLHLVVGLGLVATAACFPLQLPRTHFTVLVADLFIFAMLAALGVPAAVLAATLEAFIGALRSSKRLSTRVSGPAAAAAAMVAAGSVFEFARHRLPALGWGSEVASMAGLCLAAAVFVGLTTAPLMQLMAMKKQRNLSLGTWLDTASWIVAMALGSAFIAGLVHLNAQRHGPGVLAVAAGVVLATTALLRATLRRHERERSKQDARVNQAQREAAISQQRFMAAFTHAAIGMAIVKLDGTMLQVNRAVCSLMQREETQLVGQAFVSLLHPGDATLFNRRTRDLVQDPEAFFAMELRCRIFEGSEDSDVWVAVHCSRYDDPADQEGAGHCLIFQLHDITSRHLAESRLQHIAYHDGLTDLANRGCFHERLEVAVERTRLDANERFAVMFLDLDRFKIVNDSLGHIAGNELLREVAQRLRGCVRPIDLVARLGGDEFAVLLEALSDAEAGMRLAQRVLTALSQPVVINGTEVLPGASVGITFSDLGYRTVDEVLRDADLAMYDAKARGRGQVAMFDISMHERAAEKLALEADLRHAIGEGQLSVHFQPLYELEAHRLYGFEALARWVHPVRGPVSPAVFIALAEESGHIEALTDWVIEHAAGQLAQWQRTLPDTAHLGMHINISGRDLARTDLSAYVQSVLTKHQLHPECLTLEITETTLMGRLDVALQTMGQLRDSGVRFSIDDFGTGYSSLAYLGTLPIDSLKIDRSFVMGMHDKPQNVEIIRAVLNLAQSLGRRVVAEGIETTEQLAVLRKLGVHIGQGYLLSRPLRAEQVKELLSVTAAASA